MLTFSSDDKINFINIKEVINLMTLISSRAVEDFHFAAKAEGLQYMLVGGFAASYWGKPRFTADVDYVIECDSLDIAQRILSNLNYQLVFLHPKKSFAHFKPITGSGFRIDLMILDKETWSKLWASVKEGDFGGQEKYPLVDSLHLIAMKLHAAKQPDREEYHKDINDIVEIMLTQNYNFADLEQAGIIEKHGAKETISLLRKLFDTRISRADLAKPD